MTRHESTQTRIISENDSSNTNLQQLPIVPSTPSFQRQEMQHHRPSFSERQDFFHFISTSVTRSNAACGGSNNRSSFTTSNRSQDVRNNIPRRNRANPDATNMDANGRWEWIVRTTRTVPDYWKLERNSLNLDHVKAETVSRRISQFLRLNSVSATYHGDHVECSTSRLLKFNIHLWRKDDGVIVEIQRRRGCCLHMKHIRHNLCQALRAHEAQIVVIHEENRANQVPEMIIRSCSDRKQEEETKCALKCTERLISSKSMDEVRLGMENLLSLVDPSTSADPAASVCISHAILCGKGGPCTEHIRSFLGEYFHDIERDEDDVALGDDDGNYVRGGHFGMLHIIALQVLAHALKTLQQDNSSERDTSSNVKVDIKSWFWRNVVNALIYNVAEVPHYRLLEATLSAKCLHLLLQLEPRYRYCLEDRLLDGLINAHQCGQRYHCDLERETETLINRLSS